MIYRSPLPDVEIPDLPLTAYVLAGAAGRPDKPALIDGVSGQALQIGLAKFAPLTPARGSLFSARRRLGMRGGSQQPPGIAEEQLYQRLSRLFIGVFSRGSSWLPRPPWPGRPGGHRRSSGRRPWC